MFYYVGFYMLTSTLFIFNNVLKNKVFIWSVVLVAFLFSAFRYDAGYDFFSYLKLIEYERGPSFQRLEIFNKIIMDFSRNLDYPQLYFIFTSFIYILFMALGFRRAQNFNAITVSSMLFFIGAYLTSFDIVRQMVAVSIVFYAMTLLMTRSMLFGFLLILLAAGFHKSAFLFLGLPIYYMVVGSKKFNIIMYFIAILIALVSTQLLIIISQKTNLYTNYFVTGGNETGGKIYLMLLVYTFSLLFFSEVCKTSSKKFWQYFNLFFLGVLIYTALLDYGYFATRIAYFLFPFGFLAWSELIKSSSTNKLIMSMYVYLFSSLIFFLTLYVSASSDIVPLLNYRFYFFN